MHELCCQMNYIIFLSKDNNDVLTACPNALC